MILEKKTCVGCYAPKAFVEFNKAGHSDDGFHIYCRHCSKLRDRARDIVAHECGHTRKSWVKSMPSTLRKPMIEKKFRELLGIAQEVIGIKIKNIDPILESIRIKYKEKRKLFDNKQIDMEEGFLYCISNGQWPKFFKIGSTLDYEKRLSTYQTYDPNRQYKLEYKVYVSNRLKAETEVLNFLEKWIVSGEWVSLDLETVKASIDFISLKYQA